MSEPHVCIACDREAPFPQLYERGGFKLVRCPGCRLVFQRPQPDPEALSGAYYHDEDFTAALLGELREVTLRNARAKLAMLRAADALSPDMRVLDVGASSGAWLEVAAEAGLEGLGIELGTTTAAAARDRGLDVRAGTLADAMPDLDGKRFDLVTFWDVLEHLPDPRRELELARDLLAPGGLIAATFPNVEGLYPSLTYRIFARRTGLWEYPELPVHLYDFSPTTARLVLRRCGLSPARLETFATPYGFYRSTTLSREATGRGWRGAAVRAAFWAVHLVAYPLARLTGKGNAIFLLARTAAQQRTAAGAG